MNDSKLRLKVSSPVGVFEGYLNSEPIEKERAIELRNALQSLDTEIKSLTMYSEDYCGRVVETTIQKIVLNRSVLSFSIVDGFPNEATTTSTIL
jgi:hypothetical protein